MYHKLYKNDYQIRKDLKDFANKNPVGKLLKPLLKDLYFFISDFLPYPRDFLLKKMPKHGIYCEIGVWDGTFSKRILKICKPEKLYLIDPWKVIENSTEEKYNQQHQDRRYATVQNKFKDQLADGTVVILRQTSDEAVSNFNDHFLDFVYVDGDHSYDQVKKDLSNYYPKVKEGGFLCGDDYNFKGVCQAVNEFSKENNIPFLAENFQFIVTK